MNLCAITENTLNLNFLIIMRPRILSLMLVLCTILIAPAAITSCEQANAAQKEHVYIADAGTTSVDTVLATPGTANQADTEYTAQSVTPTDSTQDIGAALTGSDGLFNWQNILVMILGVLSTFFAVLWKRAVNTINEVSKSLQDGRIDKAELQRIIAAWKA